MHETLKHEWYIFMKASKFTDFERFFILSFYNAVTSVNTTVMHT